MSTFVKNILSAVSSQVDYIENNADYTSNYDDLLADDSAYYSDNWTECLLLNFEEYKLTPDEVGFLIDEIVYCPSLYLESRSVIQGFPCAHDSDCITSFNIGGERVWQIAKAPSEAWAKLICEYLKDNCEHSAYYTYDKQGNISAYLDYSYSYVGYFLKHENIKELINTMREEQSEEE